MGELEVINDLIRYLEHHYDCNRGYHTYDWFWVAIL